MSSDRKGLHCLEIISHSSYSFSISIHIYLALYIALVRSFKSTPIFITNYRYDPSLMSFGHHDFINIIKQYINLYSSQQRYWKILMGIQIQCLLQTVLLLLLYFVEFRILDRLHSGLDHPVYLQ